VLARQVRIVAVAVAVLVAATGCSIFGGGSSSKNADLARDLNTAVAAADGVSASDLSVEKAASSGNTVKGTVTLAGPTHDEGVAQLKGVFAAMSPVLKKYGAENTAMLAATYALGDGTGVTPTDVGLRSDTPFAYQVIDAFGS